MYPLLPRQENAWKHIDGKKTAKTCMVEAGDLVGFGMRKRERMRMNIFFLSLTALSLVVKMNICIL
jgi:hypothetical protein